MDIKLAQPRGTYQRGDGFNSQGNDGAYNNNYNNRQQATGTPFDPQAMAALYARVQMINQNQSGMGMGMGMGGGMGMGMGGMGMGGMGMGMGGGFNGGMMGGGGAMGAGMGGANMSAGAGIVGNRAAGGGGNVMAGVPRGPAAMRGGMGQGHAQGQGGGGMGPNRYNTKGQHNYRPYWACGLFVSSGTDLVSYLTALHKIAMRIVM
jgi:RNA-binding protein Musashi